MEICGYEFHNGDVCMQTPHHIEDGVPHMNYDEAEEYWRAKREFKEKLNSLNFGTVPGGYKQTS